jgi:hypothetical protein
MGMVIVMWMACDKKDDTPLVPYHPGGTDTTEPAIDSSFLFGIESDILNITTLSPSISIIGPFHGGEEYPFDVDGDGKDDFNFESFHNISPGGIDVMSAAVEILDSSFQIAGEVYADSIFLCDTTISGITFENYYNSFTFEGCWGGSSNNFQSVYTRYYPRIFSQGDTLEITAHWSAERLILAQANNSSFDFTFYDFKLPFWNLKGKKYILIRKGHSGKYIYGWLCISVNNFKDIYFFEFALQKDSIP